MRKWTAVVMLLSLGCALPASRCAADASGNIVITKVKGTPQIVRYGEELVVQDGAACELNDRIRTDEFSQADIVWGGHWGYRLLASSQCDLVSLEPNVVISMVQGDIVLNVKPMDEDIKFAVETPTAVAAVRGTQFWGHVGGADSPGTFAVWRGEVDVTLKSTGKTYSLKEGDALDFTPESKDATVRRAKDAELQAMFQAEEIQYNTGG